MASFRTMLPIRDRDLPDRGTGSAKVCWGDQDPDTENKLVAIEGKKKSKEEGVQFLRIVVNLPHITVFWKSSVSYS